MSYENKRKIKEILMVILIASIFFTPYIADKLVRKDIFEKVGEPEIIDENFDVTTNDTNILINANISYKTYAPKTKHKVELHATSKNGKEIVKSILEEPKETKQKNNTKAIFKIEKDEIDELDGINLRTKIFYNEEIHGETYKTLEQNEKFRDAVLIIALFILAFFGMILAIL